MDKFGQHVWMYLWGRERMDEIGTQDEQRGRFGRAMEGGIASNTVCGQLCATSPAPLTPPLMASCRDLPP